MRLIGSQRAVSCELELPGQSIVLFLYQPVIQLSSGQKAEKHRGAELKNDQSCCFNHRANTAISLIYLRNWS